MKLKNLPLQWGCAHTASVKCMILSRRLGKALLVTQSSAPTFSSLLLDPTSPVASSTFPSGGQQSSDVIRTDAWTTALQCMWRFWGTVHHHGEVPSSRETEQVSKIAFSSPRQEQAFNSCSAVNCIYGLVKVFISVQNAKHNYLCMHISWKGVGFLTWHYQAGSQPDCTKILSFISNSETCIFLVL